MLQSVEKNSLISQLGTSNTEKYPRTMQSGKVILSTQSFGVVRTTTGVPAEVGCCSQLCAGYPAAV